MKHIRRFWLAALLLGGVASASADKPTIEVSLRNGDKLSVEIPAEQINAMQWVPKTGDVRPIHIYAASGKILFDGESGQPIASDDPQQPGKIYFDMEMDAVEGFEFRNFDQASGVKTATLNGLDIRVYDNNIHICGVTSPTEVAIYNLTGIRLYKEVIDKDSTICLDAFGAGMLEVTIGKNTFKILSK